MIDISDLRINVELLKEKKRRDEAEMKVIKREIAEREQIIKANELKVQELQEQELILKQKLLDVKLTALNSSLDKALM